MPQITTTEEMQKYLRENYTFNNEAAYFKYCCENGRFNLYYVERAAYTLRSSFATCEDLIKEMVRIHICKPKQTDAAQPIESLQQLDALLKEKGEGYLRPYPVTYKYDCGRYFMYYKDETFERANFAMSFKALDELAKNVLSTLAEIPIARGMGLTEILEAKRELDCCKVNYRFGKYYDSKQGRSVYTIFTWRKEAEKINNLNRFRTMYCH